jgi:hypothetical protein
MRADYLISLALSEDRLPALRKKWSGINTSHDYRWEMDEVPQKHRKNAAFDVVTMDMDPTENKQYSDRLLHFYHQGQIAADDADEVRKTVSLFHDHKHLMPEKDINKYDTYDNLATAARGAASKAGTKKQFPWVKTTAAQRAEAEAGSEVVYDSPSYAVREIHTHPAMKVLGSGTKWCTVGRPDLFQKYTSKGPLYHIHDKVGGERWMAHFESGQLHNEHGHQVDAETLVNEHPELDKAFKGRLRKIDSAA